MNAHRLPGTLIFVLTVLFLTGITLLFSSAGHVPPVPVTGCSGSLGENIFTGGDFGSGAANVLQSNPQIAPGYIYTTSTPPSDGYYTVTNNTGGWSNIYSSWIKIRNNSSDPQGYMMVVNASFSPGVFYEQTITGLCANTLYEFGADVINIVGATVADHIRPDISFLINDQVFFSSGGIAQDENWHTYGFTFTTGPDENTVKLSIRNNAPGGRGNDLALDNISFRACGPTATTGPEGLQYFCAGTEAINLTANVLNSSYPKNHYQWQISNDGGLTWSNIPDAIQADLRLESLPPGNFQVRFLLAGSEENLQNSKCRVVSRFKEFIVLPVVYEITDSICAGNSYLVGATAYTQTGRFTNTLTSSRGCDSTVVLNLTVVDDPGIQAALKVEPPYCPGDANGTIAFQLLSAGHEPYAYFLNEEPIAGAGVVEGLKAGTYDFRITDRFGCLFETGVLVEDPAPIHLELGPDTSLVLGQSYEFRPFTDQSGLTFEWKAAEGLSCLDCPFPRINPLNSAVYYLKVTDQSGCFAVDSIRVGVLKDYRVYVPDAFSPNDDGINDRFAVFSDGIQIDRIESLQIFDRWGGIVFENNQLLPDSDAGGWNGRTGSKNQETGVYVYRIRLVFIDGISKEFTGTVVLVR